MTPTIGFIGLGVMGEPMARNLLDAGYSLVVHNVPRDPVDDLVEAGAAAAASPADVASRTDVIITCLPQTSNVEAVVEGEDGILETIGDGQIYVDMSTISPVATERIAEEIAERGAVMLDAPVSGGESGAIEAALTIMVGGERAVFEELTHLFDAMGESVTYCGPSGAGQTAKACNQAIVSAHMVAVSEALTLAQKAGADLEAVIEALSSGAAHCWTLDNRADRMIRNEYEPGFLASYQYKDLRIVTRAADAYGAPIPMTNVIHELYKTLETMGHGDDDNAAVIQVLEAMAGEEVAISRE